MLFPRPGQSNSNVKFWDRRTPIWEIKPQSMILEGKVQNLVIVYKEAELKGVLI